MDWNIPILHKISSPVNFLIYRLYAFCENDVINVLRALRGITIILELAAGDASSYKYYTFCIVHFLYIFYIICIFVGVCMNVRDIRGKFFNSVVHWSVLFLPVKSLEIG